MSEILACCIFVTGMAIAVILIGIPNHNSILTGIITTTSNGNLGGKMERKPEEGVIK